MKTKKVKLRHLHGRVYMSLDHGHSWEKVTVKENDNPASRDSGRSGGMKQLTANHYPWVKD